MGEPTPIEKCCARCRRQMTHTLGGCLVAGVVRTCADCGGVYDHTCCAPFYRRPFVAALHVAGELIGIDSHGEQWMWRRDREEWHSLRADWEPTEHNLAASRFVAPSERH